MKKSVIIPGVLLAGIVAVDAVTVGLYRPKTGEVFVYNNGSRQRVITTSIPNGIAVYGDWDGNGTYTPGVVTPDGTKNQLRWHLFNGEAAPKVVEYGDRNADKPVNAGRKVHRPVRRPLRQRHYGR